VIYSEKRPKGEKVMDLGLKGKTAIVTGGATGIGEAAALLLLEEGCNVAVCGRRQSYLDAFVEKAGEKGFKNVYAKSVDVSTEKEIFSFTDEVVKEFGAVDIFINNAGGGLPGALMDLSEEQWRQMLDLNLIGTWRGCKAAYPYMKGRGGAIVNISSFATVIPSAGNGLYNVNKTAINSLTITLAAEVAKDNIRVNGVIPGRIATPMTEKENAGNEKFYTDPVAAGRFGYPDDLAGGIVFLCSDYAKYITGELLVISGGKYLVQNQERFNAR